MVATAMLGVVALSFGLFYTSIGQPFSLVQDDPGLWLAGTIPFTAFGWLLIISMPTVIAAIALLSARKVGIFISLAILPLLAITFGLSVFSALRDPDAGMVTKILIDLSIASVMAMLGPLFLGWKRIRWKPVSARRKPRVTSLNKLDRP
jgi:hypothetical protein